ncbi:hypothetical protein R5R35_004994 [Gryllus longicercus]|uniref:Transforming growth factor beta regulator 1 n=1 Tax=Gryllus longicercus TaxID=2509291 RepID=A0AAN9VBP4_9ORTH
MDFVNEKKYKKKTRKLKRLIKDLVFENAALCDQIAIIQEKELIVREERKFLLRKYHNFQTASADSIPYQFQSPCTQPYSQTVSIHGQETTVKKTFARKKNNFDSPDGNRSCKNKRSYAVAKAKKLVQPIPLDVAGRPVFPIILGGPTVHSLGEVVSDRPGYHTEDYIFPVGFCSTRVYGSLRDPEKKCVYTCKVLDGGQSPRC